MISQSGANGQNEKVNNSYVFISVLQKNPSRLKRIIAEGLSFPRHQEVVAQVNSSSEDRAGQEMSQIRSAASPLLQPTIWSAYLTGSTLT